MPDYFLLELLKGIRLYEGRLGERVRGRLPCGIECISLQVREMNLAVYKSVTQCPYLQCSNICHIDLGCY